MFRLTGSCQQLSDVTAGLTISGHHAPRNDFHVGDSSWADFIAYEGMVEIVSREAQAVRYMHTLKALPGNSDADDASHTKPHFIYFRHMCALPVQSHALSYMLDIRYIWIRDHVRSNA